MSGNGEIRSYRDLLVWQKGMALAKQIYGMTRAFPDDERYGLTAQMRRAVVSVPSNIAEG
jgi:four helix bundle protein